MFMIKCQQIWCLGRVSFAFVDELFLIVSFKGREQREETNSLVSLLLRALIP